VWATDFFFPESFFPEDPRPTTEDLLHSSRMPRQKHAHGHVSHKHPVLKKHPLLRKNYMVRSAFGCTGLPSNVNGSGYEKISREVETSVTHPFLTGGFKALWLMFSIHLLLLSAIFIVASRTPKGRRLVLLCTLIPTFDTILLFHFVGVFIGTIALSVATLLFFIGGFLLPTRRRDKRRSSVTYANAVHASCPRSLAQAL